MNKMHPSGVSFAEDTKPVYVRKAVVYIIKITCIRDGYSFYKIGYSTKPKQRFKSFENDGRNTVDIICGLMFKTPDEANAYEKHCHAVLAPVNIDKNITAQYLKTGMSECFEISPATEGLISLVKELSRQQRTTANKPS